MRAKTNPNKKLFSEQKLVNQVIAYLKINGHYVWRQNTGGMYDSHKRFIKFGFKGISDIIGVASDGRMIAVECKVGNNKPTQFQTDFLEEIKRHGGIAILAYSLDDVISNLERKWNVAAIAVNLSWKKNFTRIEVKKTV